MKYDNYMRRIIASKMKMITNQQVINDIINILNKNDINITRNNNGIYFDISKLDDNAMDEIFDLVKN
jgi:hypothetical protein